MNSLKNMFTLIKNDDKEVDREYPNQDTNHNINTDKGRMLLDIINNEKIIRGEKLFYPNSDEAIIIDAIANNMNNNEFTEFSKGFANEYYTLAWQRFLHDCITGNINFTIQMFRYIYDSIIANGELLKQADYNLNQAKKMVLSLYE